MTSPSRPPRVRRRTVLTLAAAGAAQLGLPAWAQSRTIRIGLTFDNSGVEKTNGSGLFLGSSALFNAINKSGGIHGASVELVVKDDQFKPELAKANALEFAADPTVLALLHPLGTRQVAAASEAVPGMAVVGPNTGTASLHKKGPPNIFWTRANYDQELERLVSQAVTVSQTRIGLVHSNDPLGQSLLAGFKAAMDQHKIEPAVIATTPSTISLEVEPAAQQIAAAKPGIVVVGLAGTAGPFIKALREAGAAGTVIYGISISAGSIIAMGDLAHGVGFSTIVPSPFSRRLEVVRRYQADMLASGHPEFSLASMEGYVDASVLAEGLRRAGPAPSRAGLMAALESIEGLDIGGLRFSFGRGNHQGTRFVDLAVMGRGGHLMT